MSVYCKSSSLTTASKMLTMGRYSFVSPQTIAEQKLIKYDINELLEKLSVTWYVLLLDSTDMKFHCYYKNF